MESNYFLKLFIICLVAIFLLSACEKTNNLSDNKNKTSEDIGPIKNESQINTWDKTKEKLDYLKPSGGNEELTFEVENSEAASIIGTDSKYIYGKSFTGYDPEYPDNNDGPGDNSIAIIGSGYQGTIAGKIYGSLATVNTSHSMTYHSDGYIYNGYAEDDHNLQRVNVKTGKVDTVYVPAGLLYRKTGTVEENPNKYGDSSFNILITSDGKYIYNLAYRRDDKPGNWGNGFSLRVFDPKQNWKMIRDLKFSDDSYYTDGLIADGKYIYIIEWDTGHRVRVYNPVTGELKAEWVSDQSRLSAICGQYDWINDKIWLGELVWSGHKPTGPANIYRYPGYKN